MSLLEQYMFKQWRRDRERHIFGRGPGGLRPSALLHPLKWWFYGKFNLQTNWGELPGVMQPTVTTYDAASRPDLVREVSFSMINAIPGRRTKLFTQLEQDSALFM